MQQPQGITLYNGQWLWLAHLGGLVVVLLDWGHATGAEKSQSASFPLPDVLRPKLVAVHDLQCREITKARQGLVLPGSPRHYADRQKARGGRRRCNGFIA
jgi:hypothetical protein